jgi:signal transduction histidine kinase/DNA-binding response OmpR family regulator
MKILIVEDDVNSRIYMERALTSQGYSVASAENGVVALEKAESSPPDLIISDIMMPEMDGFELCRRVKTDERLLDIPFVFYTATYVDQKDEKLGMALGASRFLIKPMELEELFCAIKAVIDENLQKSLVVPLQPLAGKTDLDRMQLEVLARKLDKKVRELEEEREALRRSEYLLAGQKRVLEMIAANAPLEDTLAALMNFLECGSDGIFGSILLLDEDGVHVRHGAAPSLPEAYIKAVDGAEIGPSAGSCGTAMFRCEPVIVTDILHDPLWEGYRDLIVPYGLHACWSTPILSHEGRVLGSFAMYYGEVRSPAPAEKHLVDIATHIASIAIEHHRAGEQIRKAASAAEAANRAKSQFLANMSHELRTPMAGVLGMLEIALGGPLEEEQRGFIEIAHRSGASLVHILNDILEMTKIEAGMLSLEDEPFVLRECVRSAVDIFESEARRKGLDLVLSLPDDLPERVVGDCLRLRQVLTNLVGNAVKFTERGRVEVRVSKGNIPAPGKREFTFNVTDTGVGISEDKKHLVFRSFSQADESHTRRYGGAGLGLAIGMGIVERMGGVLTFDCEEGVGCDFAFTVSLGETVKEPYLETADRTGGGH